MFSANSFRQRFSSSVRSIFRSSQSRNLYANCRHVASSKRFISNKGLLLSLLGGFALHQVTSGQRLVSSAACEDKPKDAFAGTAFYPPIEPFHKGFLKVSDIHTIAYTMYGDPDGKPVLFVHGGPGGGTNPDMARYFDPKVYKIILVDQRGCGDSTPFANLVDNTTYDSVRDFEKLRKLLGIDKWMVFGGSWGSTLSLAYAVSAFSSLI
jgi:hypothetical protein